MDEDKKRFELPGPEKTGAFIKLLRASHNLTQEELGDMVYVTRKAVSKWENGICYPSIDLIPRLADLFGVSLEEILAGEFNCEFDNKTTINYVIRVFKDKRIKTTIRCVFVLLIFCLTIFFFENYNATKIYDVFFEDGNIYLKNSVIISTRSKQYFNFGSVWIDDPKYSQTRPINIQLYIKDKNNDKKVIAEYSTKNNSYYRSSNYEELSVSNINELINSTWAVVKYNDSNNKVVEKNIPLQIKLRYKSNDVVQLKDTKETINLEINSHYNNIKLVLNNNFPKCLLDYTDISPIYKMKEEERIEKLNKKSEKISVEYMNNIIVLTNDQTEVTINLRDNTYYFKLAKINNYVFAQGKISNKKLIINNIYPLNQAICFNNSIRDFLNNN